MLKVFVISSELAAQLDVGNMILCKKWKLDWVYKNLEEVLGAERTIQLRDVNTSLTKIDLWGNNVVITLVLKGQRQSERH